MDYYFCWRWEVLYHEPPDWDKVKRMLAKALEMPHYRFGVVARSHGWKQYARKVALLSASWPEAMGGSNMRKRRGGSARRLLLALVWLVPQALSSVTFASGLRRFEMNQSSLRRFESFQLHAAPSRMENGRNMVLRRL